MSEWLDTETRVLLWKETTERNAPPDTYTFSLVLLDWGKDPARLLKRLKKIASFSAEKLLDLFSVPVPVRIARGLSLQDAMEGQLQLVCGDAVSIFIRDEIFSEAKKSYLNKLFAQVRRSPEFEFVFFRLRALSDAPESRRFLEQFLDPINEEDYLELPTRSFQGRLLRKKARIMIHWAEKIGAQMSIVDG